MMIFVIEMYRVSVYFVNIGSAKVNYGLQGTSDILGNSKMVRNLFNKNVLERDFLIAFDTFRILAIFDK